MPEFTRQCKAHAAIKAHERSGDDLIIEGVASTGDPDRHGEVVDQESLAKAARAAKSVRLFYQHNWNAPIGKILDLTAGDDMLVIRAQVGHDFEVPVDTYGSATINVNSIRKQIEQGVLDAFSIGFDASVEKAEDDSGPPLLRVTDLYEVSVVTVPANANALFSVAKALRSPYHNDLEFRSRPPFPVAAAPDHDAPNEIRFALAEDEAVQNALDIIRCVRQEIRLDAGQSELAKGVAKCLATIKSSTR